MNDSQLNMADLSASALSGAHPQYYYAAMLLSAKPALDLSKDSPNRDASAELGVSKGRQNGAFFDESTRLQRVRERG